MWLLSSECLQYLRDTVFEGAVAIQPSVQGGLPRSSGNEDGEIKRDDQHDRPQRDACWTYPEKHNRTSESEYGGKDDEKGKAAVVSSMRGFP